MLNSKPRDLHLEYIFQGARAKTLHQFMDGQTPIRKLRQIYQSVHGVPSPAGQHVGVDWFFKNDHRRVQSTTILGLINQYRRQGLSEKQAVLFVANDVRSVFASAPFSLDQIIQLVRYEGKLLETCPCKYCAVNLLVQKPRLSRQVVCCDCASAQSRKD